MKRSKILFVLSLLFCVVMFGLMAAPVCTIHNGAELGNVYNYAFGVDYNQIGDFLAIFIPILVGTIALVVAGILRYYAENTIHLRNDAYQAVAIIACLAFLVGGIAYFNVRNMLSDFVAQGSGSAASSYKALLSLNAGPIISGILSLITAACMVLYVLPDQTFGAASPHFTPTYTPTAPQAPAAPIMPTTPAPQEPAEKPTPAPQLDAKNQAELLKTYYDLLKQGAITQEDYDKKKAEILK